MSIGISASARAGTITRNKIGALSKVAVSVQEFRKIRPVALVPSNENHVLTYVRKWVNPHMRKPKG